MTVPNGRLSRNIPAILRRWQAAAVVNWKHVDPRLIAPQGAVWSVLHSALTALDEGWTALTNTEAAISTGAASAARGSAPPLPEANNKPPAALPSEQAAFAALHVPLQACAGQFAALPIAWPDLRQMLHVMGAQVRAALTEAETVSPPPPELYSELAYYDGALEALASSVADICITKLEQEIAAHQEQTLANQHLAERFLGNASHELRTPLTAILGFAELLLEETYGPLNPAQITTVGHIENSAQNLNEIVSNMLDLLHIRAGKLNLQYRPVVVAGLLKHLHSILMPLAGRKNVQFRMELAPDLGTAEIDENIVRHIVYHLLSSALRATPAGGEVVLRVHRKPPSLVLEAQDSALHLPPEALATMLDPFPRLENIPTRGYEGWEVGLSLVRRYVELHRGELRLESLPETGTVFYVTLPLTRPR